MQRFTNINLTQGIWLEFKLAMHVQEKVKGHIGPFTFFIFYKKISKPLVFGNKVIIPKVEISFLNCFPLKYLIYHASVHFLRV